MAQYINKDALVEEIKRLRERFIAFHHRDGNDWSLDNYGKMRAYNEVLSSLDTLEVKEVNEVPATVMVNKYGNRFISSWSGLKEYDNLKEGQEIKILIPKNNYGTVYTKIRCSNGDRKKNKIITSSK